MVLVDSSVWIDYFRDTSTPQVERLASLLDEQALVIGDLVLTEVLQGCRLDREFNEVRRLLGRLHLVTLGGPDVAVQAASNYRALRALGVTVRGTVDVVQATRCIVSGHQLLHSDRDYAGFERHLGLRSVVTSG